MDVLVSLDNLTDPKQIGWVSIVEGDARVWYKVIKSRTYPFISLPSLYMKGVQKIVVEYPDTQIWEWKKKIMLKEFLRHYKGAEE